jgi:chromosome segregation ATPase
MADTEKIAELNTELTKAKAEAVTSAKEVESLKASLTNKEAEIATGKKEIEALTAKLTAFEQKEKEAQWAAFKNQIKPAFVEGEKEAVLRAKFEADKGATVMEALANGMFVTAPASKETGSEAGFVASENKDEQVKLGAGNYNLITKVWE